MTTAPAARIIGIDVARFLAIVGMMVAHLLVPMDAAPAWVQTVSSGFPSSLFAVLGGFGVVFASRHQRGLAANIGVITRGIIVMVIGGLMELLPQHNIAVVLIYFGAAIAIAGFFVYVPGWVIAVVVAVLAVTGAPLNAWYRSTMYQGMPGTLDYRHFVESVLLTGTYPVLTWIVYLLVGMILARWMLRWRAQGLLNRAAIWMLAGGAIVGASSYVFGLAYARVSFAPLWAARTGESAATILGYVSESGYGAPLVPGWAAVMLPSPHSGTLIDIAHTGGIAVAVIGACLLATSWMRKVPVILKPIVAAGGAPLTVYVLHIAMTAFMYVGMNPFDLWNPPAYVHWSFWWQLVVILTVGTVLAGTGKRGPLEYLVSQGSKLSAKALASSTTSPAPGTDLPRQ